MCSWVVFFFFTHKVSTLGQFPTKALPYFLSKLELSNDDLLTNLLIVPLPKPMLVASKWSDWGSCEPHEFVSALPAGIVRGHLSSAVV
jgi:hypothetical protein